MRALAPAAALLIIGGATAASAQQPAPGAAGATLTPEQQDAALAQATAADAAEPAPVRDPLEGFNRAVWKINMGLDKVIVRPVSSVYRAAAPRPVRRGLTHVLANLSEPWSFVNGLLQGKPKRAFNSLGRFVVNTTIGVVGLGDPASRMGMKPTPEDFGQTLASWGIKSSTYLVLPLLGPSTIRDGVGTGVAFYGDPYRIALQESGLTRTQRYGINAFEVVSARANLTDAGGDTFLKTSLDSYAAARSAYLQRRQAAILDQDNDAAFGSTKAGANKSDDAALNAALDELKTEQATQSDAMPDPATPAPDASTPGGATPLGAPPLPSAAAAQGTPN